jgi:hypothetical protein
VVDDGDAEEEAGARQVLGRREILVAGGGVAGGVIVSVLFPLPLWCR